MSDTKDGNPNFAYEDVPMTVSIAGKSSTTGYINGELFSAESIRNFGAAKFKEYIRTLGPSWSPAMLEELDKQVDEAIKGLEGNPSSGQVYLPTVIKLPSDDTLLGYIHAGVPLSLVDCLYGPNITFAGSQGMVTTPDSGAQTAEHQRGRAVDFTLAPFSAMTGLTLRGSSHHVFVPSFDPTNGGTLNVAGGISSMNEDYAHNKIVASDMTVDNIPRARGNSPYAIPLGLNPVEGASVVGVFTSMFDNWRVPNNLVSISDLAPEYRMWYHFVASKFKFDTWDEFLKHPTQAGTT